MPIFAEFIGKNILKIITSVPEPKTENKTFFGSNYGKIKLSAQIRYFNGCKSAFSEVRK
jgi:hypothetical protein